jgi:long-subunit acyl-CoA synthetase (AMP-forming)
MGGTADAAGASSHPPRSLHLTPPPAPGAVLSHANLIADAAGTCSLVEEWTVGDRHISYLPLAHIYERNNMTVHGVARLSASARLTAPRLVL